MPWYPADVYDDPYEPVCEKKGISIHDFLVLVLALGWNKKDKIFEMNYDDWRSELKRRLINAGETPSVSYAFKSEREFEEYVSKNYKWVVSKGNGMYKIKTLAFLDYWKREEEYFDYTMFKPGVLRTLGICS